jgi:hypothetical protein
VVFLIEADENRLVRIELNADLGARAPFPRRQNGDVVVANVAMDQVVGLAVEDEMSESSPRSICSAVAASFTTRVAST